jgi:hypothetical protein
MKIHTRKHWVLLAAICAAGSAYAGPPRKSANPAAVQTYRYTVQTVTGGLTLRLDLPAKQFTREAAKFTVTLTNQGKTAVVVPGHFDLRCIGLIFLDGKGRSIRMWDGPVVSSPNAQSGDFGPLLPGKSIRATLRWAEWVKMVTDGRKLRVRAEFYQSDYLFKDPRFRREYVISRFPNRLYPPDRYEIVVWTGTVTSNGYLLHFTKGGIKVLREVPAPKERKPIAKRR